MEERFSREGKRKGRRDTLYIIAHARKGDGFLITNAYQLLMMSIAATPS